MDSTFLEKAALCLSGLTALTIGSFILFVPHPFYASYGITLGDDASLLSELRAPGAGLAGFGLLMLTGLWRRAMLPVSMAAALPRLRACRTTSTPPTHSATAAVWSAEPSSTTTTWPTSGIRCSAARVDPMRSSSSLAGTTATTSPLTTKP